MKKLYNTILISFTIITTEAQNLQNPSLENWPSPTSCDINLAPLNWSNYSNGGLGPDQCDFTLCPSTIPSAAAQGNCYARMATTSDTAGEGMYQIVTGFSIGDSYTLAFDYAGSNLFGGSGINTIHLYIDDVDVSQTPPFNSSDSFWTNYVYSFTASNTSHKIGIRCCVSPGGGSGSGGIDNFSINITTKINENGYENIKMFPNPAKDAFEISGFLFQIESVNITNLFGQEVSNTKPVINNIHSLTHGSANLSTTNHQPIIVDISALAKGIYFVEIKTEKGITNRKIVKQ